MGSALGARKVAARRRGLTLDQYEARLASGLKWCTRGKHWRPGVQFMSDVSRGDGLSTDCAACKVRHNIVRRRQEPEKKSARNRVHNRIKKGRWKNASAYPCFDCGRVWKDGDRPHEYDHHRGYAPEHGIDVQPVCRACHVKRGVARGEFRRKSA